MQQTKRIIYFIFYWILFGGLINRYLFASLLIPLLPDVLLLYLLFARNSCFRVRTTNKFLGPWPQRLLIAFVSIGLLAALLNTIPPITVIWGVRQIVRYFLLLVVVVNTFNRQDVKKVHKWLYKAFYVNTVACVFQFFQGITGDPMGGMFGGNGELALFIVITIIVFTFDYFQNRLSSYKLFAIVVANFVISMWAEIKFLYFLIPLVFYASYVLIKKFNMKHVIVLALMFVAGIPVLQFVLSTYYDDEYVQFATNRDLLSEYNESKYGFTEISMNRATCIALTNEDILQDPLHAAVGYGIGAGTSSRPFRCFVNLKYMFTFYNYFTSSYVLVETGWIGYILFILFYTMLFLPFYKIYRKTEDKDIKYWSAFGVLMSVLTYVFMWYNALPYVLYYIIFFLWGVCIVAINAHNQTFSKK